MKAGDISELQVLVVAYGDPEGLDRCLGALDGAFPVTVVDNSSSSATHDVVVRHDGNYVDAGSNLGFAAAVNLGLAQVPVSDTDVLLLNPDAEIGPEEVEKLRARLHAAPDIACVAPAQHPPSSSRPSPVCWPFPTPAWAWVEAIGLGRFRRSWGYVIASVLLVRGSALADVGGFDEGFFLYAEEADWERRATKRGWKVSYWPEAEASHEGAATDPDPARRQVRFHAGVERYVRKWHGPLGWRSYQVATILTALRRALLSTGARRRSSVRLARLYARGPYREALGTEAVPARLYNAPALADGGHVRGSPRVLLVDSVGYEDLGGASTVLNEIIAGVDRRRFAPVLACLSEGRWPELVRASGTAAYSFPRTRLRSPKNLFGVVMGLRGVIRSEGIALIHASENTALPYAAIAGRLTRTPVIWHIHSPLQARSREERVIAGLLRRLRPVHIVFTSPGAQRKTMAFPNTPWSVVFPGVDLERRRAGDGSRGRQAMGIPDDAPLISMFARVEPMKGESDFVTCMGLLSEKHEGLYGLMCGPGDRQGEYWGHLEDLIRKYNLGERLVMPGDIRPPLKDDLTAASDVAVHPSHAESFGLAILEAMAAGKPVVATDTDGPRILIEDGVSGVLVPVGDVDSLSAAVGRLLDDPAARERLGAAAAQAADRFPVDAMVRQFEDLWAQLLRSRSRS